MAPKSKEQFEELRQEKREIILGYALEVFATHGYHGTSISMIATHARMAKGLLYNYFKSKEELLKAILYKGIEELTEIYIPLVQQEITPELFKTLLAKYFQILKENTAFWRLYYAIALQPSVMEIINKEFESMIDPLQKMLSKYYQSQGSTNPYADAILAHAILDGITLNFIMTHHDFPLEQVEKIVSDRLIKPSYL